jgi:hypothetical protein
LLGYLINFSQRGHYLETDIDQVVFTDRSENFIAENSTLAIANFTRQAACCDSGLVTLQLGAIHRM